MHKYLAACGCNIGRIRKNNEDNFYFNGIVLQAENRGLRDILFTSGTLASPFCVGYLMAWEVRHLAKTHRISGPKC